jgi:hypothetical protein
MKLPRVRLTVRGMLVVVAFAAVVLSAPEWMPEPPIRSLIVPVVGTSVLAIEQARRDVERSRSRGVVVGRFGLLVRIGINLPVAVLIVLCCQVLIGVSDSSLWDAYWWISDAFTRPEVSVVSIPERFELGEWIDLQVKTGLGLCLGWVALSVWERWQARGCVGASSRP